MTPDLTDRFDAVELVRVGAEALGGKGGGGRADMAQAGGPEGGRAEAALAAIEQALRAEAGERGRRPRGRNTRKGLIRRKVAQNSC